MTGRVILVLAAAMLTASIAACGSQAPQLGAQGPPSSTTTVPAQSSPPAGPPDASPGPLPPAAPVRVLTEPQAGMGPVYQLLTGARSSVDLSMYELADPAAEADLAADAARGVDVRVILDQDLEKAGNTAAYDYLAARGVHVRWGPAGTIYHQKTLTVDDATSVIMTGNLVAADYPGTRDFAVIGTSPADVAAIVSTFDADFAGNPVTPADGADLVWSPVNAQASVLSVIDGAARTLAVENEEMNDAAVTAALAAAARRGVDVTITMTADPEWNPAFTELADAGAHIRLYPDDPSVLYIHAKAIVADAGLPGQQVLVGSQNFSVASLDYNRELGILTASPVAVAAISSALTADYTGATAYSPASAPGAAPAKASGAQCTATASIYNAADDENNVYVHSNQPYANATATAGAYSHSYETNTSGYALIYLNGPPPGARITVTVGSAICTTSD